MLFLKTTKRKVEEGRYSINQSVLMIHLHQAALVIITHLLLSNLNERTGGMDQGSSSASQTALIHSYLNFAITTLKTSRLATSNAHRVKGRKLVFEGVGERLEVLLAACANLERTAAAACSRRGSSPTLSFSQMPNQLAELDARLQQIGEINMWQPSEDDDGGQQDWLAMNDVDWQQILQLLSR